jgi:hypothetical protein
MILKRILVTALVSGTVGVTAWTAVRTPQPAAAAGASLDEVRSLLRDQKQHRLHERLPAAEALAERAGEEADGDTGRELGRFLAEVIWDETQWRRVGAGSRREYPVRKVAVKAIRKLQQRGVKLESYVVAAADEAVLEFGGPAANPVPK